MASPLVSWMQYDTLLLVLIAIACYLLALLTSSVLVRWILKEELRSEINSSARYATIDGVRGFLAFGVFVHHYVIEWVGQRYGHWGAPPHNFENELGKGSVAIFFMITAFLFWGRTLAKRGLELRKFFISRVFRIYPLYLVFASLLFVAIAYESYWTPAEPASAIAKEAVKWFFFHTPIINRHQGMIFGGVAWTLLYEAWFYLSLPLLAIVFLQEKALWKKALAAGAAAGLFVVNHLSVATACAFLGGIVAVYWGLDAQRATLAQSKTATWIALACLACVGLFLYDPFNAAGIALLTVFFVVISSGNNLFGLLSLPSARWMGEISYSIYLAHGIVLWLVMKFLTRIPQFHPSVLWLTGVGIAITPLIVLVTSVSYIFIERPFIAWGHRFGKSGRGLFAVQCGAWTRRQMGRAVALLSQTR
jgi:peptidoglycan/LPS O-acetylase OafA/YrhL